MNPKIPLLKFAILLACFTLLNMSCDLIDAFVRAIDRMCAMPEYLVTRTDDRLGAGFCVPGDCSLRQAISASNGCPGTQAIRIPAGTYFLTRFGINEENNLTGDLDILDSVNIIGEGAPIIDGNHIDRVFDIKAGATVTMSGLIIQHGQGTAGGEGILNLGDLTATNILVQNNLNTGGYPGGVLTNGTATISHSAIVLNEGTDPDGAFTAGGLYNGGHLILENVTISHNVGCGLMNNGAGIISFSTIAGNLEQCEIWNSAALSVGNSIIGDHLNLGNCRGHLISDGFNIDSSYQGGANECGLDLSRDLIGVDPHLLPALLFTSTSAVRPLTFGSIAIDTADSTRCPATDGRGVTRPQGTGCDRGAFEFDGR
jgi:hypothetical protein